jgi:hypothetical protein
VAGGIRVDLEDLGHLGIVGRFQEPRAQRDCLLVRGLEGGTWFGASWTPSRHSPSTSTLCQPECRTISRNRLAASTWGTL